MPTPSASRRPPRRRVESNFVVVALAGIVAVTVLVVVGLAGLGSDADPSTNPLPPTPPATTTSEDGDAATEPPVTKTPARKARLVLTAESGDCWVQVRAGSARGAIVWEGTIEQGQTQRFVKWKRLWVSLGQPANLRAKLNGRVVGDLPDAQSVVLVTAKGVRTLG